MACFRLVTLLPDRPLFNVPSFRLCIARATFLAAPLEYFRAIIVSAMDCRIRISAEDDVMFPRSNKRAVRTGSSDARDYRLFVAVTIQIEPPRGTVSPF